MYRYDPTDPAYEGREYEIRQQIEHALIGAVLMNNRVFKDTIGIINGAMFSDEIAGDIYERAASLILAKREASAMSIRAAFPDSLAASPDGMRIMLRATSSITTQTEAGLYARQIAEFNYRTEALDALDLARNRIAGAPVEPGEVMDALAETIGYLGTIADGEGEMVDAGVVIERIIKRMDEPLEVYPTGLPRLDKAMGGGLVAGKLYGIAARMKHGKTTLLGTISYNLATAPEPTPHLYLCLEMGAEEIMQRMVARHCGFNSLNFLEGSKAAQNKASAVQAYADLRDRGLYFQTEHRINVDALRSLIIRAALSGKVKGVVVDYLQLVTGQKRGQSTADHWDYVVQTLVETAKQYGLWVLVAAQLNREGEVRGGDGLLNACDMVMYLHKIDAEYWTDGQGRTFDKKGQEIFNTQGMDPRDRAWVEMRASRYTRLAQIGGPENPKLVFVDSQGPFIEEL
jgi:replicative DNA helicase